MTISAGELVPDVSLMHVAPDGPSSASSRSILGTGTTIVFGVPGAFSPSCSDSHLPGYRELATELTSAGVECIACIAVNDAFVMGAWAKQLEVEESVTMISDGNGEFTRAVGLELDATAFGMGIRSQRYAAILQDGVVRELYVEPDPTGVTVSSAGSLLDRLRATDA